MAAPRDCWCGLTWALISIILGFAIPLARASETPNTNADYVWPDGTALSSVDFRITVTADPGHEANVFWSNQFDFVNGGTAYTGMQTNGGQPRTFLYSDWQGSKTRPGSPGSKCENFEENGKGKTCRMHYDWKEGHSFKFHVASEGDRWFGVTVTDTAANVSFKLGSIRAASTRIATGNMHGWTEYFEWNFDTATCFNQPYSRATFGLPVGNGAVSARVGSTDASGDSKKLNACRAHVSVIPGGTVQAKALGNSYRGPVLAAKGLCLDAMGGGNVGGAAIVYACNGQDNQAWVLGANGTMQLASNLSLEAGKIGTGASVAMQACAVRPSQRWTYSASRLRSRSFNLCLTAHNAERPLTIEPCASTPAQSWTIPIPPGMIDGLS